jgi:hypothetical protein
MSAQGRSTASSHPYPWSPRLTVSRGGQSQRSAYTIYSDVESDHDVFAFVPPPAGGAELPAQPPLPEPLPVLEEYHRRHGIPSLGQPVRRFTAGDISGTRPETRNTSEERLYPSPSTPDSARGDTTNSGDSDVFNFALPRQDNVVGPIALVTLNEASGNFSEDPSVLCQSDEKRHGLRCDVAGCLA